MWYFAWILESLSPALSALSMPFGMSTICRTRRSTLRAPAAKCGKGAANRAACLLVALFRHADRCRRCGAARRQTRGVPTRRSLVP